MGVKIKVEIKKQNILKSAYPVLAKNTVGGNIYLFTGPNAGICLVGDCIGRVSDTLLSITSDCWEVLPNGSSIIFIQEVK